MKTKNIIVVVMVSFFLFLSMGYALFSETLIINGTATAMGTFDVEFTDATVTEQVGSTLSTALISNDKNTLTINVPKLEYPGSYVNILVTVTNKGSIPAKLTTVEQTNLTSDPSIKVSYTGLDELKNKEFLQNETQTFNIKIFWEPSSNVLSSNVMFTIKLNYEQVMD